MLIGEVSQESGVSARMLRHYDSIGLVTPSGRTVAGYREYSDADLHRLFQVESLRTFGLSLVEVRRALVDPAFAPSELVEELIAKTRERLVRDQELLNRLERVNAAGPTRWDDVLRMVSLMHGLRSYDPSRRQSSALSTAEAEASGIAGTLAEAVLAEDDLNVAGALRWALKQSGDDALEPLVDALDAPAGDVRLRAVTMLAELSTNAANAVLAGALDHADAAVRDRAALAVGALGESRAVPALTAMVVDGRNDVEAAETLGTLARRHDLADSIAGTIAGEIGSRQGESGARIRLAQALAELPAAAARPVLEALVHDSDSNLARTATYIAERFRSDSVTGTPDEAE